MKVYYTDLTEDCNHMPSTQCLHQLLFI